MPLLRLYSSRAVPVTHNGCRNKISPDGRYASNGALVIDDISSSAGLMRQGSATRILDPALA